MGSSRDDHASWGFEEAPDKQTGTLGAYLEAKYGTATPPVESYNKPGQGIKHDQGKQRFDLIPFDLMDGEQRVWEFGAKKYAPMNWRKGMPVTQPTNAAIRHLTSFLMGENLDPETLESHIDHAVCCLRMIQNTLRYFPELDDRNVNPRLIKVTKE